MPPERICVSMYLTRVVTSVSPKHTATDTGRSAILSKVRTLVESSASYSELLVQAAVTSGLLIVEWSPPGSL